MESKAKKILIYKVRNFSEKFDDTFAFDRENWKVLFKYLTYFVLPVCLVQAIGLNNYLDAAFDMSAANAGRSSDVVGMLQNLGWNYGVIVLTSMIGAMLQLSVVYAFISHYNSSEDLSGGVDGSMFKPLLIKNLKRSGLAILFWIGLTLLGMLITILLGYLLSWWILLPVILVAVAVCIPLMLFMPAYLLEDIPLLGALSKSLRLGFATWWSTFAIMFVLGFIVSFFQGLFAVAEVMPFRMPDRRDDFQAVLSVFLIVFFQGRHQDLRVRAPSCPVEIDGIIVLADHVGESKCPPVKTGYSARGPVSWNVDIADFETVAFFLLQNAGESPCQLLSFCLEDGLRDFPGQVVPPQICSSGVQRSGPCDVQQSGP